MLTIIKLIVIDVRARLLFYFIFVVTVTFQVIEIQDVYLVFGYIFLEWLVRIKLQNVYLVT